MALSGSLSGIRIRVIIRSWYLVSASGVTVRLIGPPGPTVWWGGLWCITEVEWGMGVCL